MNKWILVVVMCLGNISSNALASDTLASCTSPKGYSYYFESDLVNKKSTGWGKDGISGGSFSLKKLGEKEFDMLSIDASKSINSAKQDGAAV